MRARRFIMGMPIVVDIPAANASVFERVFKEFKDTDRLFSPYKPDSQVSRLAAGKMNIDQAAPEVKAVFDLCQQYQHSTNGYFSAWYKGVFEPSGLVKAWAIERAAQLIKAEGYKTFCIWAGGDMLCASDGSKNWTAGIQDPADPTQLIEQLSGSSFALATSGSYERGSHIINPKTGQPAQSLLSLSVIGPSIVTADVLATAAFAAGTNYQAVLAAYPDYRVLALRPARSRIARKVVADNLLARQPKSN